MMRSHKDIIALCCLVTVGYLVSMFWATEFGSKTWLTPGWFGCDERSYILSADTFLKGRLANPMPDLWKSFEAEEILVCPVYVSKYPPGYGLILAFGQLLGHYLVASWLAVGLFAGFLYLSLRYLLPRSWSAFVAGLSILIAVEHWYWSASFGWRGEFHAAAAAAVLWGLFRYIRRPALSSCFIMGAGIAVIALVRPLEGFVFCLGVVPVLLPRLFAHGGRSAFKQLLSLAMLPLLAVVFTAVVNNAVTGKWYFFPHALYTKAYMPAYRHTLFDDIPPDVRTDNPKRDQGVRRLLSEEKGYDWNFFSGGFFMAGAPLTYSTVGLLALVVLYRRVLRNSFLRAALILMFFLPVALAVDGACIPRYFAEWLAPCIVLFSWGGIKFLYAVTRWAGRRGVWWCSLFAVALTVPYCWYFTDRWHAWSLYALAKPTLSEYAGGDRIEFEVGMPMEEMHRRIEIAREKSLVFTHYLNDPDDLECMWLANKPDMEGAKVVWARSLGPQWDQKVIARYGKGRRVFYLYMMDKGWSVLVDRDRFYSGK